MDCIGLFLDEIPSDVLDNAVIVDYEGKVEKGDSKLVVDQRTVDGKTELTVAEVLRDPSSL